MLEAHWTPHGYCVPNPTTYPWQWLWDSCFHAVVWAHLGDERGMVEVEAALSAVDPDGFVPHMRYAPDPDFAADFWGRAGTSSITQPPMFGHALAELARHGQPPSEQTLSAATTALRFLLDRRARTAAGLVLVCHPWETGCDDSPRWDHWRPEVSLAAWRATKGDLLDGIVRSGAGAPLENPLFRTAPTGFNALIAFNARELSDLTGDAALRAAADELAEAIDDRWDGRTWVDDGDGAATSGRIDTLDGLLPALLGGPHTTDALSAMVDPARFGARFGPAAVSRAEPTFDPDAYWRGPAWPQLSYLSWLAATRASSGESRSMTTSSTSGSASSASGSSKSGSRARSVATSLAGSLAGSLVAGAVASDWAEYWNPDSGAGLGAKPQSWTSLAAMVASDPLVPRRA